MNPGPAYLLEWYTHDDGTHLVVARSLKSLFKGVDRVLQKRRHADFRRYWVGHTVRTPKILEDLYVRTQWDDECRTFEGDVRYRAEEFLRLFGRPPRGWVRCHRWDPDKMSCRGSYGCKFCRGSGVVHGHLGRVFARKHGERPDAPENPPASLDLWKVTNDGHGISVDPLDVGTAVGEGDRRPILIFQGRECEVPYPVQLAAQRINLLSTLSRLYSEREFVLRRQRREEEWRDSVREMFEDPMWVS